MISLRSPLPREEEMHSDIGLPRFSIVRETGMSRMTSGFKALQLNEPV